MKKLLAALLTATLVVPGVAFAQDPRSSEPVRHEQRDRASEHTDNGHDTHADDRLSHNQPMAASHQSDRGRTQNSRFATGQRFDRSHATNYRRVSYRENRKLSVPPRGQVWVRSGTDALLVRLSNNFVTRVVSNVF